MTTCFRFLLPGTGCSPLRRACWKGNNPSPASRTPAPREGPASLPAARASDPWPHRARAGDGQTPACARGNCSERVEEGGTDTADGQMSPSLGPAAHCVPRGLTPAPPADSTAGRAPPAGLAPGRRQRSHQCHGPCRVPQRRPKRVLRSARRHTESPRGHLHSSFPTTTEHCCFFFQSGISLLSGEKGHFCKQRQVLSGHATFRLTPGAPGLRRRTHAGLTPAEATTRPRHPGLGSLAFRSISGKSHPLSDVPVPPLHGGHRLSRRGSTRPVPPHRKAPIQM